MANRHFAKLADVWKHLPLVEILAIERPGAYWETHAGSAVYPMPADDPEREYGVVGFLARAVAVPSLATARYTELVAEALRPGGLGGYPGSSMLAMLELGTRCRYVFCDTDRASQDDLRDRARHAGVDAEVVAGDGMSALHERLTAITDAHDVFAHVDPYDPDAAGPSGLSALDVAAELATRGAGLAYWYGYSRAADRAWALDALAARAPHTSLWCGDVLVAPADAQAPLPDGDLGAATTPGTGFGIVVANVSADATSACETLGDALARLYDGVALPDGSPGRLDFGVRRVSV